MGSESTAGEMTNEHNPTAGLLLSPWDRVVTEPFRAANRDLKIGDVIEFFGQMPDRRGEVLIGICDSAVWANAADVAGKSRGRVKYLPSFDVTLKGRTDVRSDNDSVEGSRGKELSGEEDRCADAATQVTGAS
ncbi:hypothetical protein UFOVP1229_55 [uncultured Caudovirales phage]|uniref:Uncharacterized protein n=1 Tax=uncultured Caudovirales phage TaxID=2100421 RepID=A0A6J5RDK7_9CAUD|nr:hypothetical protein UFOVP1229_55 [uncultured Caudovirales phage]